MPTEKKDNEDLAKQYAALCDVYVMDAFGTAHRAQASTHGVAKFAPEACAGPLLAAELDALGKALDNPAKPVVAIVGGSKVSTKLDVLNALEKVCDQIIVGGGVFNRADGLAEEIGADLWANDPIEIVDVMNQHDEHRMDVKEQRTVGRRRAQQNRKKKVA